MNDFFFSEFENPLPRAEVRLLKCDTDFNRDQRKLKLMIELTPFEDRPSLDIRIMDGSALMGSTSLVEVILPKNELAVHLRSENIPDSADILIQIYYLDISLPEEIEEGAFELPKRQVVETFKKSISLVKE